MKKALFLDRDGIVNEDRGYVYRPEDFQFKDGIFKLCREAKSQGYLVIIITNQSGIGRGYFGEEEYLRLNQWMLEQFSKQEILIDQVYHCPYHPEKGLGSYKMNSPDRKPGAGMFLKAQRAYDIDMALSIAIGDRASDVEAARRAGVGQLLLLAGNDAFQTMEDVQVIRDLREAIPFLREESITCG